MNFLQFYQRWFNSGAFTLRRQRTIALELYRLSLPNFVDYRFRSLSLSRQKSFDSHLEQIPFEDRNLFIFRSNKFCFTQKIFLLFCQRNFVFRQKSFHFRFEQISFPFGKISPSPLPFSGRSLSLGMRVKKIEMHQIAPLSDKFSIQNFCVIPQQ